MKSKLRILLILSIIVFSIVVIFQEISGRADRIYAIGVQAPFIPVDRFNSSSLIYTFHLGILCADLSLIEDFKSIPYRYEASPIFPNTPIVARPDGTRFYLGTQSDLLEFDSQMRLLRKIPISAFKLGKGNYIFSSKAHASDNKLWLTIRDQTKSTYFIVEWDINRVPESRTIGPDVTCRWGIDIKNGNIFITKPKSGIYRFDSNEFTEQFFGNYSIVDYDENYGLLLSNGSKEKNGKITIFDLKSRITKTIAEGEWALWGRNGIVFFLRGVSQLWCCKWDGSEMMPVYLVTKKPKTDRNSISSLTFSIDKRYLSYFYCFSKFGGQIERGIVCLDLESKECKEYNSGFWPTALVVGEGRINQTSYLKKKEIPIYLQSPYHIDLHDAVFFWDADEIEIYLRQIDTNDINTADSLGNTPLHYASELGRNDIVKSLINSGAEVDLKNTNGMTALHKAAEGLIYNHIKPTYNVDQIETVKVLLAASSNCMVLDNFGRTPLDIALKKNESLLSALIISRCQSLTASENYSTISLHKAISSNKFKIVESLISTGVDIDMKDSSGKSPLETAWYMGKDMIKVLVDNGAAINTPFTDGSYPLELAVLRGDKTLISCLLEKGANPNLIDKYGNPILNTCIKEGDKEMLQLFIDKGAIVNAVNKNGYTSLHVAVQMKREDVVVLLLEKGANFNAKTNTGFTPLRLAKMGKSSNIMKLLEKYGAED